MMIIMGVFYVISGIFGVVGAIVDASMSGQTVDPHNLDVIRPYLEHDLSQIVSNVSVAITALTFLLLFCWLNRKNGYRGPIKVQGQKLMDVKIFVIVFVALDFGSVLFYLFTYPGGFPKIDITVSMIVLALYAGINEEISDRAIPAAIMMRNKPTTRRILVTTLFTAFWFGLGHAINLLSGQDLGTTLIQVVFTCGAGLFFAGIYLRTGSIALPIIIHVLHDLLSFIVESLPEVETASLSVNAVFSLCVNIVPFVFGVLMLLPKHYPAIIDTWTRIWPEKNAPITENVNE